MVAIDNIQPNKEVNVGFTIGRFGAYYFGNIPSSPVKLRALRIILATLIP